METLQQKKQLSRTVSEIRQISLAEKKDDFMDEQKVNAFLDSILLFKEKLTIETAKINGVIQKMEDITWFTSLNEESLLLLNDLIASAKDLRTSLVRQYINMGELRRKGIAKAEIKSFKGAIDGLREGYEDLESVFFFLPEMPDFKEVTRKLSLI